MLEIQIQGPVTIKKRWVL